LGHQLEAAKAVLLDGFQRWLSPLREIREKIQSQTHPAGGERRVDIFVACDAIELLRLPWEGWQLAPEGVPPDTIRLARIPMATREKTVAPDKPLRQRKARILVILGDNTGLDLERDKQAVCGLEPLAEVTLFDWQAREKTTNLKAALAGEIADERGWDALFFMGHSGEMTTGDGQLAIAPDTFVSIQEIKDYLTTARKRGLQFCLFNSCSGLNIANRLANLGLQAVVMREPVHDGVAHVFLQQFCQHLAKQEDVHDALLAACWYLRSHEQFTYPSAHIIPSFFSPPNAEPFRLQPFGWQSWLRQWLPATRREARREAIALGSVLLLSLMVPVQELLLDTRTLVQAVYRNTTKQLPQDQPPPVLLIAIDRESINRAGTEIDGFQATPMDREYLAQLVTRLADLGAKTVGIDYLLDTQEPKQERLARSLRSAVEEVGTWLVLAIRESKNIRVFPPLAEASWSLRGDIDLLTWYVEFPEEATCETTCPFAYLLALSHTINRGNSQPKPLQPQLNNQGDFQQTIHHFLQENPAQKQVIASLAQQVQSPLDLRTILDFSIPPEQAYEKKPAFEFLKSTFPHIQQQVAIVAAGGYDGADDTFSMPLALRYWCGVEREQTCSEFFTGGEAHAYMVHHLLSEHQVILIPDWWGILLAALLGKGTMLMLLKQKQARRNRWGRGLVGATALYGWISLQLYISLLVSMPWFFPSVIFWVYILPVLRKESHA
jgi:CHASE2 domain-containing sensor protein